MYENAKFKGLESIFHKYWFIKRRSNKIDYSITIIIPFPRLLTPSINI